MTRNLVPAERDRALELLASADQNDPMVTDLQAWFRAAAPRAPHDSLVARFGAALRRRSGAIAAGRWFRRLLAAFFVLDATVLVLTILEVLALLAGTSVGDEEARAALSELAGDNVLGFWISMIATLIAAGFMVRGVVALRRSRVTAYRAFERAVLVDLFLAKPVDFVALGFLAAVLVFVDLLLLAALRYLQTLDAGRATGRIATPMRDAAADVPAAAPSSQAPIAD